MTLDEAHAAYVAAESERAAALANRTSARDSLMEADRRNAAALLASEAARTALLDVFLAWKRQP